MFGGVHNFFHSGTWAAIRTLAVVFVLVFWLATIYWVWKDARRRVADPIMVALATALGVIPFLGPLIYMLFRPPEYLADVRERELEMKAIERRLLGGGNEHQCNVCGAGVEPDFLVCPVCTNRLRQACSKCERPLEPAWQICPFCETPVGEEKPTPLRGSAKADGAAAPAPTPPRTQQRRRSSTSR